MRPLLLAAALLAAPAGAQEVSVELRRGPDAAPAVRAWFEGLDRLLDRCDRLLGILAEAARRPTAPAASLAALEASALADDYKTLTKDSETAAGARASAAKARAAIESLRGGDALPPALIESLFSAEGSSINRWAQALRQKALEAPGPALPKDGRKGKRPGAAVPANALLTVSRGSVSIELAVLDVSRRPLAEDGRILSAALWALAEAALSDEAPSPAAPGNPIGPEDGGQRNRPAALVLSQHRLWARLSGGPEVFCDFAARDNSAAVRLRVPDAGPAPRDQARSYFLSRALYGLGFAVGVQDGEITALLSGERSSMEERLERFVAGWRALRAFELSGRRLFEYLEGTTSQRENVRRLDELAELFAAEGRLPDGPLREAVEERRRGRGEREALRGRMRASLESLGLGSFPDEAPFGQRTIDVYYNAPVAAALARGELRLSAEGALERRPGYDPLARLAARAARPVPWPAGWDPSPLLGWARTVGTVGKWPAQLAQWRVEPDRWLLFYLLRDPAAPALRHAEAWELAAGKAPRPLALEEALVALAKKGVVRRRREGQAPDEASGEQAPADAVFGVPLRGSRALTARVTYDPARARQGDRVLVTPYVSPADRDAARRSRALLTTAAGDQAAILAALSRVPALNLEQAEWTGGAGLRLRLPVHGPPRSVGGTQVRGVERYELARLREGDAVRLYPAAGALEVLARGEADLLVRLEEALKAYDRAGDVQALAMWTIGQMASPELGERQKRDFAAALLSEMESRARTGVSPAHADRIRAVLREYLP